MLENVLVIDTGKETFYSVIKNIRSNFNFIYTDKEVLSDFSINKHSLSYVEYLMKKYNFSYIVATSERNMLFSAYLRSIYNIYGLKFDECIKYTNKYVMKKHLSNYVRMANFRLNTNDVYLNRNSQFIIKPLDGFSCKDVYLRSYKEINCNESKLYLIEDFIDIDIELHVDGVIDNRIIKYIKVSQYIKPLLKNKGRYPGSILLPDNISLVNEIKEYVNNILTNMNTINGVFHIELFLSNNIIYFSEIALRPAGAGVSRFIKDLFNIDLVDVFVKQQLNIDISNLLSNINIIDNYVSVIPHGDSYKVIYSESIEDFYYKDNFI